MSSAAGGRSNIPLSRVTAASCPIRRSNEDGRYLRWKDRPSSTGGWVCFVAMFYRSSVVTRSSLIRSPLTKVAYQELGGYLSK